MVSGCPDCGATIGSFHKPDCPRYLHIPRPEKHEAPKGSVVVTKLPPEVEPYADDIRRFVDAMVYKLKVHHKKGRWDGKTIAEYLPLLMGEMKELTEACKDGNLIEILTEAADVANMAMIIASIATERGK